MTTQAKRIIERFGGVSRLTKALGEGYYPTLISNWRRGKGFIPSEYHQAIYEAAKRDGVPLEPSDFLVIEEEDTAGAG